MYRFCSQTIAMLIRIIFGLRVTGVENIPPGGAIIASTHSSLLDPVAVAGVVPRPIHFMAKAELFQYPVFSWLLPRVHAFPVKRGLADRGAIRTAMKIVADGYLLGIFPEGTRNKSDDVQPLQGGAALIAIKAGVPVIPVAVAGVKKLRFRQAIEVRIGMPIQFGDAHRAGREEVAAASTKISSEFRALLGRN